MPFTLQAADLVLLIAGGLLLIGTLVRWIQRDRWRNPLAGAPLPLGGLGLAEAGVALLVFFGLQLSVISLLTPRFPADEANRPGSAAWHWLSSGALAAQLVSAAFLAVLLARPAPFGRTPPGRTFLRTTWLGVAAALVIVPLVTVQAEMVVRLWQRCWPDMPPPTHEALLGLRNSEWGPWGIAQLFLGAVVIAPLAEELLFRGALLEAAVRHTRLGWAGVALSAAAFGLVHLSQPHTILPLTTMGVVLGYVRLRSGSLWPCIVAHALFNARTMTFALLAPHWLE